MSHLLLISNSTQHGSGYLDHCEAEIKNFLGSERKTIVFIPFALHDWDAYAKTARTRLEQMGYAVISIHEREDKKGLIKEADAIFIGGGNTFRLLNGLYQFDLLSPIREAVESGTPYMGASAGTNVATVSIKTTNDMPIIYPPSFDALNLVPFNINPHYIDPDPTSTHKGETREQRIQEFLEENNNVVVGLREGGMLRREDDQLTLKGNTARLFFPDGTIKEYAPGDDLSFLL